MDNILAAATTIIAFVLAFTQLIKKYTGADSKWLPVLNLLTGLFLGVAWSLSFAPNQMIIFIWGGAIAGLAAGGFYDLEANSLRKDDENGDQTPN
ncbi:hypothetical protein DOK67_0000147 [Enterococcus sp. DIV0212c]|uniref:holin n=1 Tax=Enterococcus sp. DIV0212c TaxID=2230867 RepID=UPI001A9BF2E5|nr:holin [Enterococcus sp. DIV0212c]MBO1353996.1 hypothetical protein [Enterococcus sp. DIV0212c]